MSGGKSMRTAIRAILGGIVPAAVLSACIIAGGDSVKEFEPNDSLSEASDLGFLGTTTVYAQLSESDTVDYYKFTKGSEPIVEFEIYTSDSDMEYDIGYELSGGASPVYGYEADYEYLSGQSSYHSYTLKVTLDSYSSGGRYVVVIRCR